MAIAKAKLKRLMKHTGLDEESCVAILEDSKPAMRFIVSTLRKRGFGEEAKRFGAWAMTDMLVKETKAPFELCQRAAVEAKGREAVAREKLVEWGHDDAASKRTASRPKRKARRAPMPRAKKEKVPEKARHFFFGVSGLSLSSSYVLGVRREIITKEKRRTRDPDAGPGMDNRLFRVVNRQLMRVAANVTSFWVSPSGTLFTTKERGPRCTVAWRETDEGSFHRLDESVARGASWTHVDQVWGIDDDFVLAWKFGSAYPRVDAPWRFDGDTWTPFPVPDVEQIWDLHGNRPDNLYLAADHGRIFHWNGRRWRQVPLTDPPDGVGARYKEGFSSLFVAEDDTLYALRKRQEIWRGHAAGIELLPQAQTYRDGLEKVAVWKGQVLLTHVELGLMKLDGETLTVIVTPKTATGLAKMRHMHLDTRGDLLVCSPGMFEATSDGESFESIGKKVLSESLGHEKLPWASGD